MKVFVKGQGPLTLSKSAFLAKGGQGSVYVVGDTAFKLYDTVAATITAGKLRELAAIADRFVITPQALLLDTRRGNTIGYSMPFVRGGYALCQLFPPAFRQRHGLDPTAMLALVRALQERVQNIHRASALVVDLSPLNFLVDQQLSQIYAIDTDSYQTPSYPATAISPSICDPLTETSQVFSELSDWFSFAVVAFQMFIGVHPYRGKHPKVKGLTERMRQHLSLFSPEVSGPPVALGFDVIPAAYRAWLQAVLQDGKRLAPPGDIGALASVIATMAPAGPATQIAAMMSILPLCDLPAPIRQLAADAQDQLLLLSDDGLFDGARRCLDRDAPGHAQLVTTARLGRPVLAWIEADGRLRLRDSHARVELQAPTTAEQLCVVGSRLLAKAGDRIVELLLTEVGSGLIASSRVVAKVLPHASQLYPSLVVQSLLGACYLSLLDDRGGCHQLRVAELDAVKILDAKHDRGVVVLIVADHNGDCHRLVLRHRPEAGGSYDLRWVRDVGHTAVDFVTLDRGVCICRSEDGGLEIFSAKPGSTGLRQLPSEPALAGGRLERHAGQVLLVRDKELLRLSTK